MRKLVLALLALLLTTPVLAQVYDTEPGGGGSVDETAAYTWTGAHTFAGGLTAPDGDEICLGTSQDSCLQYTSAKTVLSLAGAMQFGADASGADQAGSTPQLQCGPGTGSGTGCTWRFYVSAAEASSSTLQTPVLALTGADAGWTFTRPIILTSSGSGTPATFTVPRLSATGTGNLVAGVGAGATLGSGTTNTIVGDTSGLFSESTTGATVLGYGASAHTTSVAIGKSATAAIVDGVAVGRSASAFTASVAIGAAASSTANHSIAIGPNVLVSHEASGVFGRGATSTKTNQLVQGSATYFYREEYTVASAQAAAWIDYAESEAITVDTGSATTTSSGNLVRANSIVQAVACRVTTTITTAATYDIGISGSLTLYDTGNTNVTATNTFVTADQVTAAGQFQTSAAALVLTFNATPGAGVIRCTVFGRQWVAPTS